MSHKPFVGGITLTRRSVVGHVELEHEVTVRPDATSEMTFDDLYGLTQRALDSTVARDGNGTTTPLMVNVLDAVRHERLRQINEEGFDPEHDDQHRTGDLARAAACYALSTVTAETQPFATHVARTIQELWPWEADWWKPRDDEANLIRAAALILAELERLARQRGSTLE